MAQNLFNRDRSGLVLVLGAALTCGTACSQGGPSGDGSGGSGGDKNGGSGGSRSEMTSPPPDDAADRLDWFASQTFSARGTLSVPGAGEWLTATRVTDQLVEYDPGSTARCAVETDPAYAATIDALGGVLWGYGVTQVVDTSTPVFQTGYPVYYPLLEIGGDATNAGAGPAVEIAKPDVVGLSETSALYLSEQHGLLLVDLTTPDPTFLCATKLPGRPDQFYLHNGRLVVMVQSQDGQSSALLHFAVSQNEVSFIESVDLGRARVLDSRRFNDRLVIYTELLADASTDSGLLEWQSSSGDRRLRVFDWQDRLTEELTETSVDSAPSDQALIAELDRETPLDAIVRTTKRMGSGMWASDRYFVTTEAQTDTRLASWKTDSYSVCTKSHQVPYTYESCWTEYEEVPNPNYVAPDNSGGDRSCTGATLSDCIRRVAQESAKTIRVPTGTKCQSIESSRFVCDSYETRSYTYPLFSYETNTRLYIYEYTDAGFIRFEDSVSEIDLAGLETTDLDATPDNLALSDAPAELTVRGEVAAIQFQNGYAYVISDGLLQTYALAENSLLRTASLAVTAGSLQSAQFTSDKLYLSDASYQVGSGDLSVLRVVDLSNPAFPVQASKDRTLPGGHSLILPSTSGVLTLGNVYQFEGESVNMLKLGLFEDPSAVELSYLFLGTDLLAPSVVDIDAVYFDGGPERFFVPYVGLDEEAGLSRARIGISHVESQALVTEGAVELFENATRVRPRPGTDRVLSFARSSIVELMEEGSAWQSAPVFEYFTPTALYRYTDTDDYVEVQNLGNRCRLQFAQGPELNTRSPDNTTEPFECPHGWVVGYAQNLLWSPDFGISFQADGTYEQLDAAQTADLWQRSQERDVCLLSEDLVPGGVAVDLRTVPDLAALHCMTASEYQTALSTAQAGGG